MQFSDIIIVHPTVRFAGMIYSTVLVGAVLKKRTTVRFGTVFLNRKCYSVVRYFHVSCGAVRCGFRYGKSYGAVWCRDASYGAVRCGSPLNSFCCGAVPIPVGKTVPNRFSLRCTVCINRTKPRFRAVFMLFLGALTKPLFLYDALTV